MRPQGPMAAEMLAYVDDCLPPRGRLDFEGRIAGDPAMKSQVAQWLSQNEAIRAAFRAPPAAALPVAGRGLAGKGRPVDWAPPSIRAIREARAADRRLASADRTNDGLLKPAASLTAPGRSAKAPKSLRQGIVRRSFCALVGAFAVWTSSAFLFSNGQSKAFVSAAAAAYRTFAQSGAHPVEIATSDAAAVNKWAAPQVDLVSPALDLSAAGLTLLGGRVVPGAAAPASFALYENTQRQRFALYEERLDSPAPTKIEIRNCEEMLCASWTAAGRGFVLIGRASDSGVTELARIAAENRLKI